MHVEEGWAETPEVPSPRSLPLTSQARQLSSRGRRGRREERAGRDGEGPRPVPS